MANAKQPAYNPLRITGGQAPSGNRYINVSNGSRNRWVPYGLPQNDTEKLLAAAGFPLFGAVKSLVMNEIGALSDFPTINLAEAAGWVGDSYFLPDGDVYSSKNKGATAELAFIPIPYKCAQAGTLDEWKQSVAHTIRFQTLACFIVMAAFAGPLKRLTNRTINIMFEIFGDAGQGKSFGMLLAASVWGPPIDRGQGQYHLVGNMTLNALEEQTILHNDGFLAIDEMGAFAAGETNRAKTLQAAVLRLIEGREKARFGGGLPRAFAMVGLMTTNEPIAEVLAGMNLVHIKPITSRLISIPADAQKGYHMFDTVPKRFASARDFAEYLKTAIATQHGTPIRRFIQGLVDLRAQDEQVLRARIEHHMKQFLVKVGVDPNDGAKGRVAEAFALVAVAGILARHLNVLPSSWDPIKIAHRCYRRYLRGVVEPKLPIELLREYAQRKDIFNLDAGYPDPSLDPKAIPGYRRTSKGVVHLFIPVGRILDVLPNFKSIKQHLADKNILIRDGAHFGTKRQLTKTRKGEKPKKERVYVFVI